MHHGKFEVFISFIAVAIITEIVSVFNETIDRHIYN